MSGIDFARPQPTNQARETLTTRRKVLGRVPRRGVQWNETVKLQGIGRYKKNKDKTKYKKKEKKRKA